MTPRHDPLPRVPAGHRSRRRAAEQSLLDRLAKRVRRFRPGGGHAGGGEPCPARPNRPLDLSGGAAAALEFDD